MDQEHPCKWRHYQPEIILLCVRWYLRYSLSYRDIAEMMAERGLAIDHTTIYRWVQRYAPELKRRVRAHLKPTTDSWRVDETYSKVRGKWLYLYRALDSAGNTIDFMLSPFRHTAAAEAFLRQVVAQQHAITPRVINVDGNPNLPNCVYNPTRARSFTR